MPSWTPKTGMNGSVWEGGVRKIEQMGLKEKANEMVRPTGIEPVTLGFEVQYSIQLSYGRTPSSCILIGESFWKVAHLIPVHRKTRQL